MASKKQTIGNITTTSVVYSDEGHTLGAGEQRSGVILDGTGLLAVKRGDLAILRDDPEQEKAEASDENQEGDQEEQGKSTPARRGGK